MTESELSNYCFSIINGPILKDNPFLKDEVMHE
jgi:hypothetical protein